MAVGGLTASDRVSSGLPPASITVEAMYAAMARELLRESCDEPEELRALGERAAGLLTPRAPVLEGELATRITGFSEPSGCEGFGELPTDLPRRILFSCPVRTW